VPSVWFVKMSQFSDEQILQQQEDIRKEVNATSPYVAEKHDLEELLEEMKDHPVYAGKTQVLLLLLSWFISLLGY